MNTVTPLRRLGNKRKLIPQILKLIPPRVTTFIDLFMGTGAVSFAMTARAKLIVANDNDAEVFNLFFVMKDHREELVQAIASMPYHEDLWNYWRAFEEVNPVWKAARFLMLSNFGYMGQAETMRFESSSHSKQIMLQHLERVGDLLRDYPFQFMDCDFREVLGRISWREKNFGKKTDMKKDAFLYCDPPYCETNTNYHGRSCRFTEQDTASVFDVAMESGMRFLISEFEHPFVIQEAERRDLFITEVTNRRTLENRNKEIAITNYEPLRDQLALFAA